MRLVDIFESMPPEMDIKAIRRRKSKHAKNSRSDHIGGRNPKRDDIRHALDKKQNKKDIESELTEARRMPSSLKSAASSGGKYNFNGTNYGSAAEATEAKEARITALTKEISKLKDNNPMKTPLSKELARIKKADVGSGAADDSKRKAVNQKVYSDSKADEDKTEKEKQRDADNESYADRSERQMQSQLYRDQVSGRGK